MGLFDLRRNMVLATIREFDELGRDAFLKQYGYGPARHYFLVHGGRRYDSKAIAGVAHRGVSGRPLQAAEFSGGNETVARVLSQLGFTVTTPLNTPTDRAELLAKVGSLETAKSRKTGMAKRHQPLTLMWALGRAARGEERLASWATTHHEISGLIRDFGLVDDGMNPEYPILKLTQFGLWAISGHDNPPPAHGSRATNWMKEHQPDSGLIKWVHDIATNHEDVRAQVVVMLLNEYFQDVDHNALLGRVGLAATDAPVREGTQVPDRRETTTSRVVRDTALAYLIKSMHGHRCQVCGDRLRLPNGFYAEGAHIRPLGKPHNGPDMPGNLLCLCPNHHVMFDGGAITITDDLKVVDTITGDPVGPLRTVLGHDLDKDHLSYHRHLFSTYGDA